MLWAIFKIPSCPAEFRISCTAPVLQEAPQWLKIPYKASCFITSFISGLPGCDPGANLSNSNTSHPLKWLPSVIHIACELTVKQNRSLQPQFLDIQDIYGKPSEQHNIKDDRCKTQCHFTSIWNGISIL